GVLSILQQLTNTFGGFLPGYDLSERSKTGGLSSGKVNTLFVKPHADLITIKHKSIAATIEFWQSLGNLLGGFSSHIFQSHYHSQIGFIAAQYKHPIDLIFR